MIDLPGGSIARQDEVLELLYWLEGEGFKDDATLVRLARFLTYQEDLVLATLTHLIDRGDVRVDDETEPEQYRLTDVGRRDAARRFAAEFAPLLSQGHGECSDPNCDCHDDPSAAAECHATRAHQGHQH